MQDYSSYSFKGFWFQPEYPSKEEVKPFGNNNFLKKYWDEDSFSQDSSSNTSMFENYFNFDFDGYSQNIQGGNYPSSYFDSYFNIDFNNMSSNIGSSNNLSNSTNNNYFGAYEEVLNNFYSSIGYTNENGLNNNQSNNKSCINLDNNYNSYFNPISN